MPIRPFVHVRRAALTVTKLSTPFLILAFGLGCPEIAQVLEDACPEGQILTAELTCVPNATSYEGFGLGDASPATLGDGYANINPADFGVTTLRPWIDWRAAGYVTPVKDQGPVGTCVTFAASAALESALMIQTGVGAPDLSEQYLVDCTDAKLTGYDILLMADDLLAVGIVNEGDAPYSQTENNACPHPPASTKPVQAWYGAGDQMIKAMLHLGPVVSRMVIYSDISSYSGGVYRHDPNAYVVGGHAVTIVGYNDAEGAWLVKNSWGTGFGESGYFRVAYGDSELAAYGILFEAAGGDLRRGPELLQDCESFSWFQDLDGDGFGDPNVGSCTQQTNFVNNRDDCYDLNADAHPGQELYYSGTRGDGSYDFDCDGTITLWWTQTWSCTSDWPDVYWDNGWDGTVPGCGGSGTFYDGCDYSEAFFTFDINGPESSYEELQYCR
jgi:hypothetical protein